MSVMIIIVLKLGYNLKKKSSRSRKAIIAVPVEKVSVPSFINVVVLILVVKAVAK